MSLNDRPYFLFKRDDVVRKGCEKIDSPRIDEVTIMKRKAERRKLFDDFVIDEYVSIVALLSERLAFVSAEVNAIESRP